MRSQDVLSHQPLLQSCHNFMLESFLLSFSFSVTCRTSISEASVTSFPALPLHAKSSPATSPWLSGHPFPILLGICWISALWGRGQDQEQSIWYLFGLNCDVGSTSAILTTESLFVISVNKFKLRMWLNQLIAKLQYVLSLWKDPCCKGNFQPSYFYVSKMVSVVIHSLHSLRKLGWELSVSSRQGCFLLRAGTWWH